MHLMANLYSLVIFICNYCIILAVWNTKDYMKREHSLIKPYQDARWDFIGSTMVTNNYVRLTPDHQSRRGAIWNTMPCLLRDWEMHIHFNVHGQGSDLFGDGFAFWYTKDRQQLGDVFGNKDYFHGLAVFFDTYSNHNGPHNHGHPYISSMVNNGTMHYDHDRDGTHTELAGCEAQFRNKPHDTHVAVRYEMNTLTVSMDIDNKDTWKHCFKVEGVRLPTGYFFGASATTGDLADNHDIISLKLYDIEVDRPAEDKNIDYRKIEPSADYFAPPREHVEDVKPATSWFSGFRLFLLIFFTIVVLGAVGLAGLLYYMKLVEDRKKRFY